MFRILCLAALAATLVAAPAWLASDAEAAPDAATQRGTVQIIDTSPTNPRAGERFTITFALVYRGQRLRFAKFGCFAQIARRPVPLVEQERRRRTARCTWAIPAGTQGEEMHGILVIVREDDSRAFRGFEYAVQ
jgi:hypothetical protein